MKKILFCCCSLLFNYLSIAQQDSLQLQINEQVWKPFIKAFNTNDNKLFSSVHSKEVIRVEQDDSRIIGYDEYFKPVPDSILLKWGRWKKNIELRFVQRIAGNDKAFEVGYYKTTSTNMDNNVTRTGYGKFHVLLRKEDGTWKILMDADAHEGTNETIFLTGAEME